MEDQNKAAILYFMLMGDWKTTDFADRLAVEKYKQLKKKERAKTKPPPPDPVTRRLSSINTLHLLLLRNAVYI